MHDDAEEVDGDGAVNPGEHRVVIAPPRRGGRGIRGCGVGGGNNMGCQAIAAEGDEKQLSPVGIVAIIEIEGDWDMEFDGGGIGRLDGLGRGGVVIGWGVEFAFVGGLGI